MVHALLSPIEKKVTRAKKIGEESGEKYNYHKRMKKRSNKVEVKIRTTIFDNVERPPTWECAIQILVLPTQQIRKQINLYDLI